jgi:pyruvate kinase
MRQFRSQTKVIVTIGPACSSKEVLEQLFHEGVDCCRLNFSHSSYEEHENVIRIIKELNEELGTNVTILGDLQGPKLRVGEVENNGVMLEEGQLIRFVNEKCVGNAQRVYMSYAEFPQDVAVGDFILLDDGKLKFEVVETNKKDTVVAKVICGGVLSSKKGVNLPNTKISLPSLTQKDIEDAQFILDHDIDWIALSFVRTPSDVIELKQIIKRNKKSTKVIAKIEKPEALSEIDGIIEQADAIMVARGDLGVEVPFDRVPVIQRELVKKCIEKSKPVIIATQMLESMVTNFRPTRAEATDVSTAVLEGADAVMLSGETSVGKYPVLAVNSMQMIIDYTEANGYNFYQIHGTDKTSRLFLPDTVCATACKLARDTDASAIITFTNTGYTALKISSHRPAADIFMFTSNKALMRTMQLCWGIRAFYIENECDSDNTDNLVEYSVDLLKSKDLLKTGEIVVHVASTPLHEHGRTNMLKMSVVP